MNANLYEYLTRISMDAFVVMDVSGKILEANDAAVKMYGYACPFTTIMGSTAFRMEV